MLDILQETNDVLLNLYTEIERGGLVDGQRVVLINASPAAAWSLVLVEIGADACCLDRPGGGIVAVLDHLRVLRWIGRAKRGGGMEKVDYDARLHAVYATCRRNGHWSGSTWARAPAG